MLSENKIVRSIELVFESKAINVSWFTRIMRDDVVVSENISRSSYLKEDKQRFIDELGKDSKKYISLIW